METKPNMREREAAQERGSALDKALAVLEAITAQSQPIGLPDLSARLALPRQTVHRVLAQLEAAGLVVRDPSRDRFSVGPRLSTLRGTAHARCPRGHPAARAAC